MFFFYYSLGDIANSDRGEGLVTRHLDNLEYSTHKHSNLANDNDPETCSKTAESNSSTALNRTMNPFWKVWFPANESVAGVIIKNKKKSMVNRGEWECRTGSSPWKTILHV